MRICVFDYQGKSEYLTRRLVERGHLPSPLEACDVLLIDQEWSVAVRETIARAKAGGARIVTYGHGMPPLQPGEGHWEGNELVDAMLVPTVAHAGLYAWTGERRMIVCGWFYCEPLTPVAGPRVGPVVFAPIHTELGGVIPWREQEANRRARELLAGSGFADSDAGDGRPVPDAVNVIDGASLVVGNGTFAYLAVARGCPTVFFDQPADAPAYPLDLKTADVAGLAASGAWPADALIWRERMIGPPFDPACLDVLW